MLFKWLDLEAHREVDLLLKQFGLTEADTPVVSFGRKIFLRNPSNKELAELRQARRLRRRGGGHGGSVRPRILEDALTARGPFPEESCLL